MRRLTVAALALSLAALVGACRLRSRGDGALTDACTAPAIKLDDDLRRDGGAGLPIQGPESITERCRACCRAHGRSDIDPNTCVCGDRGLDVLLK